jgi:hypothetical protein
MAFAPITLNNERIFLVHGGENQEGISNELFLVHSSKKQQTIESTFSKS